MPDEIVLRRLIRWLLVAGLALAVGGLIWMVTGVFDRVHNTLTVIVFSILFGYLVYPPVKWLANRAIPVVLAAIIVYAALGVVVLGSIAWLAPAIAVQATDLAQDFPHVVASVQHQIADPTHAPLLARLPSSARSMIAENTAKIGALVGVIAGGFGTHAIGILSGTTAAVIDIFLVLGLTLLILGDLAGLQSFGIRIIPQPYRPVTIAFMEDVDGVIGGFVRGQVLLAVAVGVSGTIVLLAVGVPYAILFGVLAGVVSVIPMVGPIIAAIPVLLIAFFTVGLLKLIIVAVLYAIILVVQQNVLTPMVISKSVGVTPLVVFVALLLGSEAFGILGALLSIPIAGIVRVAAERLFPPDPQSDAMLVRTRNRSGEPLAETRAVAVKTAQTDTSELKDNV
jgi:predicted PurR-regulated permease PerM